MRVHKPQGEQSRGTSRDHQQLGNTPQHKQQDGYPSCSPTSACAGPVRAEGGTGKPAPKKRRTGKGGNHTHLRTGNSRTALSTPLAHIRRPWEAEDSRRNSHTTARRRTHSTEAGNSPSQATPQARPTGPTDRTPRDHLPRATTASQKRRTTTATQPLTGQGKKPPHAPAQTPAGEEAGHRPRGRGQKKDRRQKKKVRGGGRGPRGPEP